MSLRLTIVDHSPVHGTSAPDQAPSNSIVLAKACDGLGYDRFWVAEHHDNVQFASPCPEIMIGAIAAETKNMRIGSGGIMLSHYSPYKVAETFRLLSTLHPGRIDLGIGRAPGGTQLASMALSSPHGPAQVDHFPQQAAELCAFLWHQFPSDHPYRNLRCLPDDTPTPEMWMLGSGGGSSSLAGQLGTGLALAKFILPEQCTPEIFDNYARYFNDAGHKHPMQKMLAVAAICAPTTEEARFLAAPAAYRKAMARFGPPEPLLTPQQALDKRAGMQARVGAEFDASINSTICGTPEYCADQLFAQSREYATNDIALVTVTHGFDSRLRSFRLLAECLGQG